MAVHFGEKARKLFDEEKISVGRYLELLHKIVLDADVIIHFVKAGQFSLLPLLESIT